MRHPVLARFSRANRSNRYKSNHTFARILVPGLLALVFLFAGCGVRKPGMFASGIPTIPSDEITTTASVPAASPAETPTASAEALSPEPTASTKPTASTPPSPPAKSATPTAPSPPSSTEIPSAAPPPAEHGIIVKSENELSSAEKQQLLEELEKELDALFAEINDVSAEEEMEAQN